MNDSDPRPMPVEVQRAYRDPVDLHDLLMSSVYSEQDRRVVLGALMRSLIEKHGDVWISAGSKETRVSTRIKQTKKSIVKAIELLSSVEEYGGSDGVLPLLAQAMQPTWAQWWESFEWFGVEPWSGVVQRVLGGRQLAWLAAQYARTAIGWAGPVDRSVCMNAIKAAEAWALVPSKTNRDEAWSAREVAIYATRVANAAAGPAGAASGDAASAASAYYAAANASDAVVDAAVGAVVYAAAAAHNAAISAAGAYAARSTDLLPRARARDTANARLADLTRRLITPTLVTSAS